MLKIFRRRKVEEEIEEIKEIEVTEEWKREFGIDFYLNKSFEIGGMPMEHDPDYYGRTQQSYSEILVDLAQRYTEDYKAVSDCLYSLMDQNIFIGQLKDTVEARVKSSGIKNTQYIQKLVQDCFDTYSQNREDAIAIFKCIFIATKDVEKCDKLTEKYKKQLEDLVADNDKIIESLKSFLAAFGKYSGDERFTPEHFMDMSAVRRLDQFSKLLEGISSANEATMQELIARLAETPTPANDSDWQERLENVPKIVLDPEVSTTTTADGF